MKIKLLPVAACLFYVPVLFAQQANLITVKAGEDFMLSILKEKYYYAGFTAGTVVSRDGSIATGKLNYNLLNEEMQFISPKGDTLSLANEQTIQYISVGKDSFFFDHGYLALIIENQAAKLAIKQKLKIIDKQKIGAYGQPSSTGAIQSQNSIISGSKSYSLNVKEDIVLAKETSYYLSDRFYHFVYANKKNLMKLFYRKQDELEKFLRENKIDFNNLEDMTKLVVYLGKI